MCCHPLLTVGRHSASKRAQGGDRSARHEDVNLAPLANGVLLTDEVVKAVESWNHGASASRRRSAKRRNASAREHRLIKGTA